MLLVPNMVINHYSELTAELLKSKGISLLICDLDYTLASKKKSYPDADVMEWVRNLKQNGIELVIISNNRSSKRVTTYCEALEIPYVGHAQKPLSWGFEKAMEMMKKEKNETAVFGDKILTDTLGGHFANLQVILTEPEGGAVTLGRKVIQALQEPFKKLSKEDMR